jgi:hypothetical protein
LGLANLSPPQSPLLESAQKVFVVTTLVVGTSCSESSQITKVVTTSPDADFLSTLRWGEA